MLQLIVYKNKNMKQKIEKKYNLNIQNKIKQSTYNNYVNLKKQYVVIIVIINRP